MESFGLAFLLLVEVCLMPSDKENDRRFLPGCADKKDIEKYILCPYIY